MNIYFHDVGSVSYAVRVRSREGSSGYHLFDAIKHGIIL